MRIEVYVHLYMDIHTRLRLHVLCRSETGAVFVKTHYTQLGEVSAHLLTSPCLNLQIFIN